ncbi:MAG: head-tail connector protein [Bacillus sp. (in: firmicutes)]
MLDAVKLALRITHEYLDSEISDLIEAARHDLTLSGVLAKKTTDDKDPLIKRAIITYVKANFLTDGNEAERFQQSYNLLKTHLTLSGDYNGK